MGTLILSLATLLVSIGTGNFLFLKQSCSGTQYDAEHTKQLNRCQLAGSPNTYEQKSFTEFMFN